LAQNTKINSEENKFSTHRTRTLWI